MKTISLLFSLALVSGALAASPGVWYDGNKILPDRPYQKAKEGLGVQLQLTKNLAFFTDWALPKTPHFEIDRTAQAGDKVYSALFFFGAGTDQKGESYVTFSGRVLDPHGMPIQTVQDVRAVRGPNSSGPYNLRLSDGYIIVQFSNGSQKGTYTFEVTVTDHVKNVIIPLVQTIDLK